MLSRSPPVIIVSSRATSIYMTFYVYRSDAFDLPEWVSVSGGDYEEDHYFEADGTREARYSARLVVGFDRSIMTDLPRTLKLADLKFEVEDTTFEGFVD